MSASGLFSLAVYSSALVLPQFGGVHRAVRAPRGRSAHGVHVTFQNIPEHSRVGGARACLNVCRAMCSASLHIEYERARLGADAHFCAVGVLKLVFACSSPECTPTRRAIATPFYVTKTGALEQFVGVQRAVRAPRGHGVHGRAFCTVIVLKLRNVPIGYHFTLGVSYPPGLHVRRLFMSIKLGPPSSSAEYRELCVRPPGDPRMGCTDALHIARHTFNQARPCPLNPAP